MSELSEFTYPIPPGTAWEYSASIVQITSTPASVNINITIPSGEILWLESVFISAGTFSTGRVLTLTKLNSNGGTLGRLITDTLATGEFMFGSIGTISAATAVALGIGFPFLPFPFYSGQQLLFTGVSLANAEVYTIRISGRLLSGLKLVTNTHITAPIAGTTVTEIDNVMNV